MIPAISSADPIAVKGDLSFTAANGFLTIERLVVGEVNPQVVYELPEGCPKSTFILEDKDAVIDVILSDDNAVVADFKSAKILKTVDVSACFSEVIDSDSCDDKATVDLESGNMVIPCLEANGKNYYIEMNRRGKSDNWEVDMKTVAPVILSH